LDWRWLLSPRELRELVLRLLTRGGIAFQGA
jgi:hypothetical protein